MHRKLTITLDEDIYQGLYATIGAGKISQFIEKLVRPYVATTSLKAAYKEMQQDEARENEANTWIEGVIGDISDEAR